MVLQALEFSDCFLDSPHFREKLNAHEKELENTNKTVRRLIAEGKDLINAAKSKLVLSLTLWLKTRHGYFGLVQIRMRIPIQYTIAV